MDRAILAEVTSASSDESRPAPGRAAARPSRSTTTGRTLLLLDQVSRVSYLERALVLWPRLDRRALRRASHDPQRMACCIAKRTSQPIETIVAMLTAGERAQ